LSILAPGTAVPEFTLKRADGTPFTRDDLLGTTTVLVFYPFAFSSVCTDQLSLYDGVREQLADRGVALYAVSTDASPAQAAFQAQLGIGIEQLSDFEPKGATARAFGAYFEPAGMTNRGLVVVGPDGVVTWSHLASSPGELPSVELLLEGVAASVGS
jgi:peroxiredoxin (alkyl hydroperoxide reductase subunit C)